MSLPTDAPPARKNEIPLIAVVIILVALTPFAMYFGVASISANDPSAFRYGLAIAALLLSTSGSALRPSSANLVAAITFYLTVVAPFILWLFTSSIGGVAPGPIGGALGAIGSCAGLLTSRIRPSWIPLLLWVPALALGFTSTARYLGSMKARDMNAESASPSYVAANVLPKLIVDPPQVSWMDFKYGPGHEETGGTFIAQGNFLKSSGGLHIKAYADTAQYTIMIDTTSPYKQTSLAGDIEWLRSQRVRVDTLRNIETSMDGWTAVGPDNLQNVVISRIRNQLVIGGSVELPTQR